MTDSVASNLIATTYSDKKDWEKICDYLDTLVEGIEYEYGDSILGMEILASDEVLTAIRGLLEDPEQIHKEREESLTWYANNFMYANKHMFPVNNIEIEHAPYSKDMKVFPHGNGSGVQYGYIYKITEMTTGKYYIGKRKSSTCRDGYCGSGNWIRTMVEKITLNNIFNNVFTKTVVRLAETRKQLNEMEKYYIGDLHSTDVNCMNLKQGG